jgi:RNA polymerase sigma factor (sigma-70 family)
MIFEQQNTRSLLRGMVRRLTDKWDLEDDLVQEAIIHLWLREKERPGQSRSWYIQSCRQHLQNFLRRGRSVDGGNHRCATALRINPEAEEGREAFVDDTFFSLVCARDLEAELDKWLTSLERQILSLCQEGLSLREIGERLQLSHTTVRRRQRNIAALASRLGRDISFPAGLGQSAAPSKRNDHFHHTCAPGWGAGLTLLKV